MGVMGKIRVKNPLTGIKHKTKNPCKNGGTYGRLKKAHTQVLGTMGMNKPKSPIGK